MAQEEAKSTARGSRQLALPPVQQSEVLAALAYIVCARAGFIDWDRERATALLADIGRFCYLHGTMTKPELEQLEAGF